MITKTVTICLIMQITPGALKKLTSFRIEFKISFINYETTLKWFLILVQWNFDKSIFCSKSSVMKKYFRVSLFFCFLFLLNNLWLIHQVYYS